MMEVPNDPMINTTYHLLPNAVTFEVSPQDYFYYKEPSHLPSDTTLSRISIPITVRLNAPSGTEVSVSIDPDLSLLLHTIPSQLFIQNNR